MRQSTKDALELRLDGVLRRFPKGKLLLHHRLCWLRGSYGVRVSVHDLLGAFFGSKDHRGPQVIWTDLLPPANLRLRLLQRGLKGSPSLLPSPPPDDRDRRPHHPHDPSSSAPPTSIIPQAVIVAVADRQDETQDIGLESMRSRKTATRIACTVLPVPYTIRIDTETVREVLSGL